MRKLISMAGGLMLVFAFCIGAAAQQDSQNGVTASAYVTSDGGVMINYTNNTGNFVKVTTAISYSCEGQPLHGGDNQWPVPANSHSVSWIDTCGFAGKVGHVDIQQVRIIYVAPQQ